MNISQYSYKYIHEQTSMLQIKTYIKKQNVKQQFDNNKAVKLKHQLIYLCLLQYQYIIIENERTYFSVSQTTRYILIIQILTKNPQMTPKQQFSSIIIFYKPIYPKKIKTTIKKREQQQYQQQNTYQASLLTNLCAVESCLFTKNVDTTKFWLQRTYFAILKS
eukprot:TRINITY_DN12630_c0_g1_i1.p1 TRINITY_DN12630_c0_g1~~TRINITY_DN12630_c0_g1_i1.p1  ORF type:complete len:185 (-),score=-16.62 TRINITY_DN12630_c0_g1_i1:188-676(-)